MDIEFKANRGGRGYLVSRWGFVFGRLDIGDLPKGTDLTGFQMNKSGIRRVISVLVLNEDPVWAMAWPWSQEPIPDITLSTALMRKGINFDLAEVDDQDQPVAYVQGRIRSI